MINGVIKNDVISDNVIYDICNAERLTRTIILDLIGNSESGQNYSPHVMFELDSKHNYAGGKHKTKVKTTLGCLIVNKVLFEELYDLLGYQNKVMDSKFYYGIMEILNAALVESKISPEQYIRFCDMREAFSNALNAFFTPTPTLDTFTPPASVLKLRDELLEKHKDAIARGDAIVAAQIEKELLAASRKYLEDNNDQGLELYDSGAKSTFNNNYKSRIFNGPVMNPETGEFSILSSNYYEGTKVEDIPKIASSMVAGAYAKGVGTAVGGYAVKQANAAFQSIVFDEIGTDCGTDKYLDVEITNDNYKNFMYRYFIVGDKKYEMMTLETKGKFIGKVNKLRDVSVCKSDKTCATCSGEYLQRIGIKNAGLTTSTPYNAMVNKSMKKFHDVSLKVYTLGSEKELNDLLIEIHD